MPDNKFFNKEYKVIISGYYGFGNIGDEAILTSIIDIFKENAPNVKFIVLSSNPKYTQKALNVDAIHRLDIKSIIKELKTAHLFISGGGGLMQDVTGLFSVAYYGGLLSIAKMMKVPTMIYAQGFGPLRRFINRTMVKNIFNKTNAITIRDRYSVEDLINLGVKENKITLTADPVLLMNKADKETVRNILWETGLDPDIPTIGISIRYWHSWYERQLKAFTSIIYQFARKYNFQILLIPYQRDVDLWLCQETALCFALRPHTDVNIKILERQCTPKEIMGIIGEMNFVIGMRLHSLIMAAANSVPSIGISYDPKVYYFTTQVGFPCISSIKELQNMSKYLPDMENIVRNRDKISKEISEKVFDLKKLSLENMNVALKILEDNYSKI